MKNITSSTKHFLCSTVTVSAVLYNTAMRGFAMKIYKYDEKL